MSANINQIVVYQPSETVRLEHGTVWLTQYRKEYGKGKKAVFAAEVVG